MDKNENETEIIKMLLDSIYHQNKKMDEKIDCLLHAICKNDSQKAVDAIRKYLISDFRNNRNIL